MTTTRAVATYLAAIVTANLAITVFGPGWSVLTAFLLIGLDLSLRDSLHDRWEGRGLVWRMGLLIAAGGLLSFAINAEAARIALASTVAFTIAASLDAVTYHLLRDRPVLQRMNASNVVGAALDSLLFPLIAFGGLLVGVTLGQFAAKVAGGALWAWVIRERRGGAA